MYKEKKHTHTTVQQWIYL